ncbi:hypothetical protein [Nocardioides sp. SYSU DS0663]|uniref:hypothetical protein n=1 Tax=Nocardioides sp. SYSU DS0663 TaxID=3416445 RepID=UPI003F4C0B8C
MSLLDAVAVVVLPALRSVFDDDEVSSAELAYSDDGGGPLTLALTARGETFHDLVVQEDVPHTTAEEWRERLRSNLVDFVAESRFGWGENRDAR